MAPRNDRRFGGPSRDGRPTRDAQPGGERRRGPQRSSRPESDRRDRRDWKRDGERFAERDQGRRGPTDRYGATGRSRIGSSGRYGSDERSGPSASGRSRPVSRPGSISRSGPISRSGRGAARSGPADRGRSADRNGSFPVREGNRRRAPAQERRPPLASRSQREAEPTAAAANPPPDDLIWGRHSTQAALESGRPVHRIWCTPEMRSAAKFLQLLRDAKASGVLVEEVTWARLGQITGGSVHQGIALQVAAADTLDLDTLIDGCSDLGEPPLLLALDGVTDPHNLGAVVRSAEAMGAHGVVLPQRRSAGLTGSVAKVAAGALEHMPVARVVNLNRSLEKLKDSGYRVIGLASEGDTTLIDADLDGPLVLVTGSEGQGLSLLTRRHCDQLVRIPLRGITPSLNASVATALCVYEVARRSWMKDIHGQSPSPPMARPQTAAAESASSDRLDPTEPATAAAQGPAPATESLPGAVETERIQLDLTPTGQKPGIQFDQSIQLSP